MPPPTGSGSEQEIARLQALLNEREAELRRLQLQLAAMEQLYDTAPVGRCLVDHELCYVRVNEHMAAIHGRPVEDHLGKFVGDILPEVPTAVANYRRVLETGRPILNFEVTVPERSRRVRPGTYLVNHYPVQDEAGRVTGVNSVVQDITGIRQASAELEERVQQRTRDLAESEARFRQLTDNIREVFWLGAAGEEHGQNVYVSPAYEEIWGRSIESLRASPTAWIEAVHEEDRPMVRRAVKQLESIGQYDVEYRINRPDGTLRWIRDRAFPVKDDHGNILRIAGIAEDITKQKEAEQQLRSVEQLLRRLIDVQEQERRMVAHDIHDGFIQDVIGAHMHLQALDRDAAPETVERVAAFVSSLLEKAVAEGRRLISDMRPLVLDEAGVLEAIRHLLAEQEINAGLEIDFSHEVHFKRLEPKLENAIFRIVQEAVNNIRRHSGADRATVALRQRDNTLTIVVRDEGAGFDPKAVSPDRFGLRGIRERARLFHGNATIESQPGEGTTVTVKLPLRIL